VHTLIYCNTILHVLNHIDNLVANMNSSTDPEKENVNVELANDTHPIRSASTIVEKEELNLEKAAGVQTATSASSVADKAESHNEPTSEAQDDTAALFQEPQIQKWRLIPLYVR
jgi:hypothetical protein